MQSEYARSRGSWGETGQWGRDEQSDRKTDKHGSVSECAARFFGCLVDIEELVEPGDYEYFVNLWIDVGKM